MGNVDKKPVSISKENRLKEADFIKVDRKTLDLARELAANPNVPAELQFLAKDLININGRCPLVKLESFNQMAIHAYTLLRGNPNLNAFIKCYRNNSTEGMAKALPLILGDKSIEECLKTQKHSFPLTKELNKDIDHVLETIQYRQFQNSAVATFLTKAKEYQQNRKNTADVEHTDSAIKAKLDYKLEKFPQLQEDYDKVRIAEKLVTRDLLNIVHENGASLTGLEYSAKTASSVEDKLERLEKKSYIKPEKAFPRLNDMIRYTQICGHNDIFPVAKNTIDMMEDKGYKLCAVNNYYINNYPRTGYKGLHMNFIAPTGQVIEMQVHSEESFAIKQQGHELYEKIRAVSTPLAEKEKLEPQLVSLHGQVIDPPGYETIKDYQMPAEEKQALIEERQAQTTVYVEHNEQPDYDCLRYSIMIDEAPVLDGFEIHQSDGSVAEAEKYNDQTYYATYTNEGEKTSEKKEDKDKDIDIFNSPLMDIARINEMISGLYDQSKDNPVLMALPESALTLHGLHAGIMGEDKDALTRFASQYDKAKALDIKIKQFCAENHVDKKTAMELLNQGLNERISQMPVKAVGDMERG